MARKTPKQKRYGELRPHTARIVKLAEYPLHVNGGYMDDPDHIPLFKPKG